VETPLNSRTDKASPGARQVKIAHSRVGNMKSLTALITPTTGVIYALTAKSGTTTKTGACKTVTIKQGKVNVARSSCTVKLTNGAWLASVTPAKGAVKGTVNTKRYTFK
jgi:hypothetical protein